MSSLDELGPVLDKLDRYIASLQETMVVLRARYSAQLANLTPEPDYDWETEQAESGYVSDPRD